MDRSLETPEKIRNLQKKLYLQATPARGAGEARVPRQKTGLPVTHDPSPGGVRKHQEPRFRFYRSSGYWWAGRVTSLMAPG